MNNFGLEQNSKVKLKRDSARSESLMLSGLTKLINTPDFSEDPDSPGKFSKPPVEQPQLPEPPPPSTYELREARQVIEKAPAPPPAPTPAPPRAVVKTLPDRVFTTGRLKSGKDFVLAALGFNIIGFADPLYKVQNFFFGTSDKKVPGARKFLQVLGQWGRGLVSEQYPLTTERAVFIQVIRALAPYLEKLDPTVEWLRYGQTENLWLDSLVRRANQISKVRVAASNVRFENEHEGLTKAGFTHYHVMCSPATLEKRLAASKLTLTSPEVTDYSERLAISLDAEALKTARATPSGNMLRVIWNDPEVASPSHRFYTVADLK